MLVPKTLREARVLLVRHAKSRFNNDWPPIDFALTVFGTHRYRKEHFDFVVNKDYIDCDLCEEGIKQCNEAAPMLNMIRDITTVFVSPMNRTL